MSWKLIGIRPSHPYTFRFKTCRCCNVIPYLFSFGLVVYYMTERDRTTLPPEPGIRGHLRPFNVQFASEHFLSGQQLVLASPGARNMTLPTHRCGVWCFFLLLIILLFGSLHFFLNHKLCYVSGLSLPMNSPPPSLLTHRAPVPLRLPRQSLLSRESKSTSFPLSSTSVVGLEDRGGGTVEVTGY